MKKQWLLIVCLYCGSLEAQLPLKLWYKQPSGSVWENALPIGNGKLGAMVYGNVATETLQLNEHTVWSGGPNRNDNPLALDSLTKLRELIFEGKYKEAERLANKTIITKKSHGQMFQPVGDLQLVFKNHEQFSNYYRELDIAKAIAKTSYQVNGVTYQRATLASFTEPVIVMQLTASQKASISFTAFIKTQQPKASIITNGNNELTISGITMDHESVKGLLKFKGIVRIKTTGGNISRNDTSLIVSNADAATIYISIATGFNNYKDISGDENNRAAAEMLQAYGKPFSAIEA